MPILSKLWIGAFRLKWMNQYKVQCTEAWTPTCTIHNWSDPLMKGTPGDLSLAIEQVQIFEINWSLSRYPTFSGRSIFTITSSKWTIWPNLVSWIKHEIYANHHIFRCASISWFQGVSQWVSEGCFSASASSGLLKLFFQMLLRGLPLPFRISLVR